MSFFNSAGFNSQSYNQNSGQLNSQSISSSIVSSSVLTATFAGDVKTITTIYTASMGVYNTSPYNKLGYNQASTSGPYSLMGGSSSLTTTFVSTSYQVDTMISGSSSFTGSFGTEIVLVPSRVPRPNTFNRFAYNVAPFNSSRTGNTIDGIGIMTASLGKVVVISNLQPTTGVYNSIPYNQFVFNGASTLLSGGVGSMAASFSFSTVFVASSLTGNSFISGQDTSIPTLYSGGYGSKPFNDVELGYANTQLGNNGSTKLVDLFTGVTIDSMVKGSGDINPSPYLQTYSVTGGGSTSSQNTTYLRSSSRDTYLALA